MRLQHRRLLLASILALAGCQTPTVTQQTLVRCPAVAPSLDCVRTPPPKEGHVSSWSLDMMLWAGCLIEEIDLWNEAWDECAD